MLGIRLYIIQRLTALLMAPLVLLHLAVMIYAIQGGLSAAEILGRTQGSVFWGLIYSLFVLAVSFHAAIGIRVIAYEWAAIRGALLDWITGSLSVLFLALGSRAVYVVVLS